MTASMFVRGFATFAPYAQLAHFPLGPEVELPKPDLALLERSLRRGLSDVTRIFMHVAHGALTQAQVDARAVHPVFASAFGEIATAEAMLAQAYDENDASPARFRHSVHNTAVGLFSISAQSTLPATALAAGWETVAMGLLEARCLLADGAEHVLLVFAEERVPEAVCAGHAHAPLGAAFVLSEKAEDPVRGRIWGLRRERAPEAPSPFAGKNHPLGPALVLARLLKQRAAGVVQVGDGEVPLCVNVDAREAS